MHTHQTTPAERAVYLWRRGLAVLHDAITLAWAPARLRILGREFLKHLREIAEETGRLFNIRSGVGNWLRLDAPLDAAKIRRLERDDFTDSGWALFGDRGSAWSLFAFSICVLSGGLGAILLNVDAIDAVLLSAAARDWKYAVVFPFILGFQIILFHSLSRATIRLRRNYSWPTRGTYMIVSFIFGLVFGVGWPSFLYWAEGPKLPYKIDLNYLAFSWTVFWAPFYFLMKWLSPLRPTGSELLRRDVRSRLTSHYIGNLMSRQRALLGSSGKTDAQKVEDALAQVEFVEGNLNLIIGSLGKPEWSLTQERQAAEQQLALAQAKDNSFVWFVSPEDEETKGRQVPPLILQPMIENALKHGVPASQGNGSDWWPRVDVMAYFEPLDCGGRRFVIAVVSTLVRRNSWSDPAVAELAQSIEDGELHRHRVGNDAHGLDIVAQFAVDQWGIGTKTLVGDLSGKMPEHVKSMHIARVAAIC